MPLKPLLHPQLFQNLLNLTPMQCPIQPPVTSPFPGTRRPRPTITKAPFNCPRTAEEWEEADKELSRTVVPTVLLADTVEERNQALCEGVYGYFSSKYGTRSQKKPKSKKHRGKGNAAANKARMMRNQARNDLRKAKRSGQDPQAIKKLAQKFHKFLRQHYQMQKATIRKSKHNEARRARKDCAKHFWSFASQTLDGDCSSKQVEPAFQADAAESFFTHVYSSCKRKYKQPEWLPDAPAPQQEFDESPIHRGTAPCHNQEVPLPIFTKPTRPGYLPCLQKMPLFGPCVG